jgi:hypothetical protein
VEALGKMTIEETYKGMWSSDATLLKSLLDAGETIIAVHNLGFGRLFVHDCEYVFDVVGYLHYIEFQLAEFLFMIPPLPLVLEPKPLEWTVDIENTYCAGKDGMYLYMVDSEYGTISIALISHDVKVYESKFSGSLDAGKAAIREWRVNHLKSMLP